MRKILLVLLFSMLLLISSSCKRSEEENVDDSAFWNNLYKSSEVNKVTIGEDETYTKASYGYTKSTIQGFNRWYYYQYKDSNYTELDYDGEKWTKNGVVIKDKMLASSGDYKAARGFKSTLKGTATICGNFNTPYDSSASLTIYINNNKVYPSNGTATTLSANDHNGIYYSVDVQLNVGDFVYFVVDGKADTNPTIRYGNYNEVLYQVPEWNFWGDVHPYFYNGTMYMYNILGYLEDENNRNIWNLHLSTDFFNYEQTDYYIPDFVQNHHMSSLYVYNSVFDKETFKWGNRDMHMFFDPKENKYIYIGLCYYEDLSSCLGCRVSDDETGTRWTTPMYSIRDYAFQNDPECTQAIYINDRWYILTSVWGESIHSVGRPTYYIGDKGKSFLENDWSKKTPYYLDGEDLCAYQFVDVGEGNLLMYGWIPKSSYGNDEAIYFDGTRDHGLWGGNINMARQVYQNSDGTLSTKLDIKMTDLLSRGRLYKNDNPKAGENLGTYDRSFVTFDVDIAKGCTNVSYNMISSGKTYRIMLEQRQDGAYMVVKCDQDVGHPIASSMRIGDSIEGKHSIQIIVDRSVTEFFVDNKHTLTARISMFDGIYSGMLYSNGNATFSNLEINKLAHVKDVYD